MSNARVLLKKVKLPSAHGWKMERSLFLFQASDLGEAESHSRNPGLAVCSNEFSCDRDIVQTAVNQKDIFRTINIVFLLFFSNSQPL